MTLRDLTEKQVEQLREICDIDFYRHMSARHTEKTVRAIFRAGFDSGMKTTLNVIPKPTESYGNPRDREEG